LSVSNWIFAGYTGSKNPVWNRQKNPVKKSILWTSADGSFYILSPKMWESEIQLGISFGQVLDLNASKTLYLIRISLGITQMNFCLLSTNIQETISGFIFYPYRSALDFWNI